MSSSHVRFSLFCVIATLALLTGAAWAAQEQVLHTFTNALYGFPASSLISDSEGNMYGVTLGSVFELSPSNGKWVFQLLHTLPAGSGPGGRLLRDANGNLYGVAESGGAYNCGFVYRLSPSGKLPWIATVMHQFNCKNGSQAGYGLVADSSGNFYGAAHSGGAHDEGVVYELSPSGNRWTYRILHNFSTAQGNGPQTALIFDNGGNLYGGNETGIFKLTPNGDGTWSESAAYTFNSGDGSNPLGDLMFDSLGNLYGTNQAGGQFAGGTAFMLTPNGTGGWSSTVMHSFAGNNDGWFPQGGLVMDSSGNLYGTTTAGGGNNNGTVYELSLNNGTWSETMLHRFGATGNPEGTAPFGTLVLDSTNNLYGVTGSGGDPSCGSQNGCGVVYEILH